jgi:hypothetical protein
MAPMMTKGARRKIDAAPAAMRKEVTVAELPVRHGAHPTQIDARKQQPPERVPRRFPRPLGYYARRPGLSARTASSAE